MPDPAIGPPTTEDPVNEARDFLRLYTEESGDTPVAARAETVLAQLRRSGHYRHTADELLVGARIAWRNSVHCLGKAYWQVLRVRDARDARGADDVFDECVAHLREATNGGKIQAVLTVFAPHEPDRRGPRIRNQQLIQYAGYRQPDGTVIGDPLTVDFTDYARSLGWPGGPGTPFDVLPLVIEVDGERPRWYPLPADAVLEVPLSHPELPWFAELGLRWYAHPAISNQLLRLGGLTYPAAPFSGWYTATEVGARNLSDTDRYDLLPVIADRMGLDRRSTRTLWRDRALVELVAAVLHSYERHGVTIVDHHFIAGSFVRHEQREQAAGRTVSACWRSLVAPTAASTTPTFHRSYSDEVVLPNFFPHDPSPSPGTLAASVTRR